MVPLCSPRLATAALLSLLTILSTQEHIVNRSATHNAVYSVGSTDDEPPNGILPSPILVVLAFSTSVQNLRLKVFVFGTLWWFEAFGSS